MAKPGGRGDADGLCDDSPHVHPEPAGDAAGHLRHPSVDCSSEAMCHDRIICHGGAHSCAQSPARVSPSSSAAHVLCPGICLHPGHHGAADPVLMGVVQLSSLSSTPGCLTRLALAGTLAIFGAARHRWRADGSRRECSRSEHHGIHDPHARHSAGRRGLSRTRRPLRIRPIRSKRPSGTRQVPL